MPEPGPPAVMDPLAQRGIIRRAGRRPARPASVLRLSIALDQGVAGRRLPAPSLHPMRVPGRPAPFRQEKPDA